MLETRKDPAALVVDDCVEALQPGRVAPGKGPAASGPATSRKLPASPAYLLKHYWWAYVHPNALKVFDHQWMVEAILWGNYGRLRDVALDALGDALPGRTLQVAAAYGDLTPLLVKRVTKGNGALDVIDVLPIQLANLRAKLDSEAPVETSLMDSTALGFKDGAFDRALVFFLMHEQPEDVRRKTLAEAFRVVRPGGRIVIIDYARPKWWNPYRYFFRPFLAVLEPFALDMWRQEVAAFLPRDGAGRSLKRRSFFGGLYQLVTIEK
jgi:ubiquinone/menaquinone biosynthesis C-methylase UbiE